MASATLSHIVAARRRRVRALTRFFTCVGLALLFAWLSTAVATPIAAASLP